MKAPRDRLTTVRQALANVLRDQQCTARDLSYAVSIPEREVGDHLEHLERSLAASGERLVIEPPACIACGFTFEAKASRPSRCPRCKSERIRPPEFSIEGGRETADD